MDVSIKSKLIDGLRQGLLHVAINENDTRIVARGALGGFQTLPPTEDDLKVLLYLVAEEYLVRVPNQEPYELFQNRAYHFLKWNTQKIS